MSDLIERLRYHASDLGSHAVPCREAADQIEALDALDKEMTISVDALINRIEALEAALREIAEISGDCTDVVWIDVIGKIASAALGKDTGK
jgi:hypothetical protein